LEVKNISCLDSLLRKFFKIFALSSELRQHSKQHTCKPVVEEANRGKCEG
jgi:hypothetical protein